MRVMVLGGTRFIGAAVVEELVNHGHGLLVVSSMDVYRAFGAVLAGTETDPLPVDETSPVRPERYPYRGRTLRSTDADTYEKLDVEAAYLAREATVCRLPMVYGERDHQRREEPLLRRLRAGRDRIP